MNIPFSTLKYVHSENEGALRNAFDRVFEKGWFINGEECKLFEEEYASYCGCRNAVGCGNGLDAITIALLALGIKAGDEVIVPAFTFIATAIAVERTGATPVFVDVEEDTTLIDASLIEEKITERTKAIVPVHLYGQPVDIDAIEPIAKRHGLFVVYDSAQAHGAQYGGRGIATYGDASCFSFYPGKNLGALGDGGAAVTNDDSSARKMKAITNYGSEVRYHHDSYGLNTRLDELQASFLRVKLKSLDKVNEERRRIAELYLNGIKNPRIVLPKQKYGTHVWHIFSVHTEDRDALQDYLKGCGIETNIHYPIPMHLQKSFSHFHMSAGDYPVTEKLARTELSLPLFYGMTDDQVAYCIDIINKYGE